MLLKFSCCINKSIRKHINLQNMFIINHDQEKYLFCICVFCADMRCFAQSYIQLQSSEELHQQLVYVD